MRLFESKTDINTPQTINQNKLGMPLEVDMLNTRVRLIKKTSLKEHLEKIKPYLGDMIDDLKRPGKWKNTPGNEA